MTVPANVPVDVMAILTDLQQQVSDLTGIVEAQQRTLDELSRLARPEDPTAGQPGPGSRRLPAAPAGPDGT
jgi:hypothetical protein